MQVLTTFAAQLGLFVERVRLAQEAERARVLEASDQLKSALLSSVSHDLRTPLSAIKASATVLLQQDVALDAAARYDLLSAINEETDRLNRLVGDLLDMSRIEAGALRLKLDWCDLDELMRAVVHRLSPRMTAFHVKLDWPPDLPLIYADYVQIDRVITNLLENAIRFAPPDSTIEITARAEAAGDDRRRHQSRAGDSRTRAPAPVRQVLSRLGRSAAGDGHGPGAFDLQRHRRSARRAHLGGKPRHGETGARFIFTLPLPAPMAAAGAQAARRRGVER